MGLTKVLDGQDEVGQGAYEVLEEVFSGIILIHPSLAYGPAGTS